MQSMRVFVVTAPLLLLLATLACDEDFARCYPGDFLGCTCANGQQGYAACTAGAYGACTCDGSTPGLDAGVREAGTCGGSKALFEDCGSSDECASCLCDTFGTRRRCTITCTELQMCPAPSDGCSNRNVCRPPP
jgi:hypothetical protein